MCIAFDRTDIQYLRNYLFLIVGKIGKDDKDIKDMFEKGILVNEYA